MVASAEVQELDNSSEEYSIVTAWPEGARTSKLKLVVDQAAFVRMGAVGATGPVLKKLPSESGSPAGFAPVTFHQIVEIEEKAGIGLHVSAEFPTLQ